MSGAIEVNLDALVGPTHHYGGLASGNLASTEHRHLLSSPKQAALEGLAKMKMLADRDIAQAVLPPQPRPALTTLRSLGFIGDDHEVIRQAHEQAPAWLHSCYSASAMWAANAATLSPAADTDDARLHISPANLISQFHRSIEPPHTGAVLRALFSDERLFVHHPPLPAAARFADEGAANHLRLTPAHEKPGLEIFVYGDDPVGHPALRAKRFTSRQTPDAAAALVRRHQLPPERVMLLKQHPAAIDAGVFHNDVISVANEHVLVYHERAFAAPDAAAQIDRQYRAVCGESPVLIEVPDAAVSLVKAVSTYLFNSQLLSRPEGGMLLLSPDDCRRSDATSQYVDDLITDPDNPIDEVQYVDVRQSMRNGGGPACLRLRAVLSEAERHAMPETVWLNDDLYERLRQVIEVYWRDQLHVDDLADPALIDESREAVRTVVQTLGLVPVNLG